MQEDANKDLKCKACRGNIDNVVMVYMSWLAPDYENKGLKVGTSSHHLCSKCATKVRDFMEGNVK